MGEGASSGEPPLDPPLRLESAIPWSQVKHCASPKKLFVCLFDLILMSHQHSFSYKGTGLPVLKKAYVTLVYICNSQITNIYQATHDFEVSFFF